MNDQISYKGARFYKCALQVNPYSYAAYQDKPLMDEQDYNQKILEQCQENKIEVVGLADHGKIEDSEGLRSFLKENGVTVFPGFEIASSEKIHMVCLYPETIEVSMLNQYLGQLMDSNNTKLQAEPTHPSSLSCEQIANNVLKDQNGFWYAAHMTGKNGLLKLSGAGDNYVHLWKKDHLVIAGQIPGKIEDLNVDGGNSEQHRKIIKNENPDYKRNRSIAIINAKDIARPEDLEHKSASCRIKMTEPSFDAFKQAFSDPESRIRLNHQIVERQYSFIKSIKWQGAGFFEDSAIAFSQHLNAVIGGRGTGKSTLIESIRYALDLPVRKTDNKVLDALRKNTLSDSQIILNVVSKTQQGNSYTISRRYGEQPVVKNAQGDISNLSPKDILPDIELLGQNDILEIEEDENVKFALIYNLLPDSSQIDTNIDEIKRKLAINRDRLIKEHQEFERLDEAVSQQDKLKEKEMQFKRLGIEDKLKNVRLLEGEENVKARIVEQYNLVQQWLDSYQEVFDLGFLQDFNIEKLPNKGSIVKGRQIFERLQEILDDLVDQANKSFQKAKSNHETIQSTWQEASDKIRDELNQVIAKLPEQAGKTGKALGVEYTDIIRKLTLIENQKKPHKNQKDLISLIVSERKNLLEEYRDTAFQRFDAMHKAVEELNHDGLKGKVRISVIRCGNVESLKDFLLGIENIGQSKIKWLDEAGIELDLVKWVEWIKERNTKAFMDKYKSFGLTQGVVDKLLSLNLEKRLELQEVELKDKVNIDLNTAHDDKDVHYVPLDDLSTGQKCTAILNLLLLSCDDPLIIDQPEDNLDNAFIAERIVQDLRQFKTNRQFLFATHNANIPVFGDAELIAVLDSSQGKGWVKNIGSIDKPEVGRQAAEILEGGKAAFNIRKEKYGF